jgi:3-oxoacyl-[acyl-carrier-protein] synthase-1
MTAIAISAAGMVTPVGFNARTSCAAIRAGIRNVAKTNLWDRYSGTYLAAGRVPLPQWWVGLGKLADLCAPAIHECYEAAKPLAPREIPVLLGVAPRERPCRLEGVESTILLEIQERLSVPLHGLSRVFPHDHVSVIMALRVARDILSEGRAKAVIVAAVDSLVQQDLKNYYLEKRRLLTPSNSNGFSLGEAGSAVLVMRAGSRTDGELEVLGTSISMETATIESDEPLRGVGLTNAIRAALSEAGVTMQEVQYRITDINGEHYKFKEVALQGSRFMRKPTGKLFDLWHPIEYIGDVGAAIGPLIFGLALHASKKGYAIGPTALFTLGNDSGERAAVVVHYREGMRG